MHRISPLASLQFVIFAAFIIIITLSPSLNIIPKSLIVTSFHDSQRLFQLLLVGLVLLHSIIFYKQ